MEILGNGYIELVDSMGDDLAIVNAARKSFAGESQEFTDKDKKLLKYLWDNKHCYHKDMEVLTINGWKSWESLGEIETFLVPDIENNRYRIERLKVNKFHINEEIVCFENNRMSFKVTDNHRMLFKNEYLDEYKIYLAKDMKKWGHFMPLKNITLFGNNLNLNETQSFKLAFVGFYIGDGYKHSKNKIYFRIKKQRKIEYLEKLLLGLSLSFKKTIVDGGVSFYSIDEPDFLKNYVDLNNKAKDKSILNIFDIITNGYDEINSLLSGLINSDGSLKADRNQIEYFTRSKILSDQIQLLSNILGYDCHIVGKENYSLKIYLGDRTTLESRKQYYNNENYNGYVYCTTTSSGLLAVRGNNKKFGFICGNSSPFEMVEFKFAVKAPLFVARQWMRHRTFSINEVSRRYTSEGLDFYIPDVWRMQSKDNKQSSTMFGSSDELNSYCIRKINETGRYAYDCYVQLLSLGICREQARMVLPQSMMVEFMAKVDLHNLIHFLRLRDHIHAQEEIREYAKAIKELIRPIVPETMKLMENSINN